MSKIKYLSAFLLLFTAFAFTSCDDNEPIDPNIVLNPETGCAVPTSFQASNFSTTGSVTVSWLAGGEEQSWEIQYGAAGFALGSGTSIFSESTNVTVANLVLSNDYQFYVRSNCSENEVSSWVGPIAVNSLPSPNCETPTNFTASRVANDATKVGLSWNAGTATSWEVQYGAAGFAIGTGTIEISTTPTFEVTGLQASNSYGFYVRAVCSPTEKSAWTAVATVVGTNTGGGGTSGDYWPTAINNQWNYSRDGSNFTMKIIGMDTFGGLNYYKFSPQSGSGGGAEATQVTTWLNKNNGVYTMKYGDINISAGPLVGVQTGFEYIVLKDNIAVNQTWSGTYSQTTTYNSIPVPLTQTTTYTGKILEKDVTVNLNGVTYQNVIKVNIKQDTSIVGQQMVVNTDYWYAKNIGVINTINRFEGGDTESILLNYTLN